MGSRGGVWERERERARGRARERECVRVLHRILTTQLIFAVTGFACGSFKRTKGGLKDRKGGGGRGGLTHPPPPPHPPPFTYWSKDRTLNNHTTDDCKIIQSICRHFKFTSMFTRSLVHMESIHTASSGTDGREELYTIVTITIIIITTSWFRIQTDVFVTQPSWHPDVRKGG